MSLIKTLFERAELARVNHCAAKQCVSGSNVNGTLIWNLDELPESPYFEDSSGSLPFCHCISTGS